MFDSRDIRSCASAVRACFVASIAAVCCAPPLLAQESQSQLLIGNMKAEDGQKLQQLRDSLGAKELQKLPDAGAAVWSLPEAKKMELDERLSELDLGNSVTVTPLVDDFKNLMVPVLESELTPAQRDLVGKIRARENGLSLVSLVPEALATHALLEGYDVGPDSGVLNLELSTTQTLSLVKDKVAVTANGLLWTGSEKQSGGDVLLLQTKDGIAGSIHLEESILTVQPVGGGVHAVFEKKVADFPPEHPEGAQIPENQGAALQDAPPVSADQAAVVTLLIAYTKKVARARPNPAANVVGLAVAETNKSFVDSGVPNLSVEVVHVYETSYEEDATWDNHLIFLAGANDGKLDEVHVLRDQYEADVVLLIMDDDDYCGMASAIPADAATAFAVVHYGCATGYYSFGHELGHLFGARHDRNVDSSTTPYAYGHGYLHTGTDPWRTIMGYGNHCGGCPRIGLWSNPDGEHKGLLTGTADHEDNARVLRESARTLARFR